MKDPEGKPFKVQAPFFRSKKYLNDVIGNSIALFPEQRSISLEKEIEDFDIGSRHLFPLGVITNGLLTNIMKYAFPGGREGLISVTLEKRKTLALLTVQDNGAGLPDDFNPHNSASLGLMLVHMLSEQIDGTFRLENSNGCRAVLSFEIP